MPDPREPLGRLVHEQRRAWIAAHPGKFYAALWEDRDDSQRELDMRIGAVVAEAERERIRAEVREVMATFLTHYGPGQGRADDLAEAVRQVLDRDGGEMQERSDEKEAGTS